MSTINEIIQQVNSLSGYNMPTSSYIYVTGSGSIPVGATVYVLEANPVSGSIPTEGIYPGGVIKAQQILNIINAFNGVSAYNIAISGSLNVSGSTTLRTTLNLPFVPDQDLLVSDSGSIEGTDTVDGGTF
jgi:hypothetical protein